MDDKKKEFGKRLGALVDAKFGPRQHVHAAKVLGVTQAQLSRFVNGKTMPEVPTIQRLAAALGVPFTELIEKPAKSPQLTSHPIDLSDYRLIPDWGVVSAGPPRDPGSGCDMVPVLDLPAEGEFISLTVRGASMAPRIPDGARIIVRVQPGAESGETVIAYIDDGKGGGGLVVKRARWNEKKERMELLSEGGGGKAIPYDTARIVGVLKSYTVTVQS